MLDADTISTFKQHSAPYCTDGYPLKLNHNNILDRINDLASLYLLYFMYYMIIDVITVGKQLQVAAIYLWLFK